MTAYHEMLSGMGHQGGMSNMAADDSHRLTVRIVDSTGVPVNDAVVTIEADKEGSNDGQMLKARNTGGIYGASLKLGAPGSYALEVMFAGADGQQRAAQMDYQQR
jgi:protocatechuate 3,4-dioxygenase beta subunit